MVLDHVLVNLDPGSPLRSTVTRAALPLFMVVSGHLIATKGFGSWQRWARLGLAALVALGAARSAGLAATPDVLIVYLFAVTALVALRWAGIRSPIVAGSLGIAWGITASAQVASTGWTGYQPGFVLALLALGMLATMPATLPGPAAFWTACAKVGRYPLAWYLGHLVVLGIIRTAAGLGPV